MSYISQYLEHGGKNILESALIIPILKKELSRGSSLDRCLSNLEARLPVFPYSFTSNDFDTFCFGLFFNEAYKDSESVMKGKAVSKCIERFEDREMFMEKAREEIEQMKWNLLLDTL